MTPTQRRTLIFFAANGFVMTPLLAMAGLLYVYGPCIEPYVAGAVIDIPKPAPSSIWRGYIVKRQTGREVEVGCFTFVGLKKLAPTIDPKFAFTAESPLSDPIPVSSYIGDDDHQDTGKMIVSHAVGDPPWDRTYCLEISGSFADGQALTIRGHAEFTRLVFGRPFPFWRSQTPVPEFEMKAERCYRPNRPAGDNACRAISTPQ